MEGYSKILFGALFALLASTSGPTADGSCSYCPQQVALSQELATCYLNRLEKELEVASSSGLPVHMINLADCSDGKVNRTAGSTMPDPRGETLKLDQSFLIEPVAMVCLAKQLREEDFDPERVINFDISVDCSD